jgi:membrane-bound ClpP family serine protease
MTAILLLFLLGLVFLAFEVFVPGAVLGIMGGLAMLGGCVLAFNLYGPGGGLLATLVALVILAITLYVELVLLPKTRFGKKMLVQATVEGTSQPALAAPSVVGKTAITLTPLTPTGLVEIEGKRFEAFCRSGHAGKGESLQVVGLDNFRLIVTKL